jgi:putative SOS response-associated peptidase YedK
MQSAPQPFDSDAPLGARRALIRRNPDDAQETELVEAVWGSNPRFTDGVSYRFIRSEGKTFPSNRCLIAASEFHMTVGERRYRVTLETGNFFYLAAIWEPAMGEWPLAYRIVTVAANAEVSVHQERHGAILHRRQVMQWLDATVPEQDLLVTPPARTFIVEELNARGRRVRPRQQSLAL